MKKFLLTAVLVLAVVVSLTAGTMASYRTNTHIESANMQAKTFSWLVTQSNSFNATSALKMAPGDAQKFTINIENNGDTPMAIFANPSLDGVLADQLDLTLEGSSSRTKGSDAKFEDGYELVTGDMLTLTYRVYWSYDAEDTDNDYINATAVLKLDLGAEQVNRSFVNN